MGKTLTKAEIVDVIYEQTERSREEVKNHVESLLEIMKQAVKRDHALLVSGFGKFEVYPKNARKGRNPQTSEAIVLEPRNVVVFRLSKKFRSEINQQ
jgi:integration host factor subunit alpha